MRTKLCDLLGIKYPIVQAGMAHIAGSDLAAAVSNAGGLGVIAAAGMTGDELRAEIRRVRELTDKPFGVDIILPAGIPPKLEFPPDYRPPEFLARVRRELGLDDTAEKRPIVTADMVDEQVEVIFDERVPVLISGLGDPAPLVPGAHAHGMRVLALVGNVKTARRVAAGGVDAVIAQGHEAGGHTGRIGTFVLIPQVVDAVRPVPVLAAGGIGDGRGLLAALMLGAVGVWVGTRFLASQESLAPAVWKERIAASGDDDTVVQKYYTGKPNRVLRTRFLELWEQSGVKPLPMPLQGLVHEDIVSKARAEGRADYMRMGAGQVSGLIREVKSAGEVVHDLVEDATRVWREHADAKLLQV